MIRKITSLTVMASLFVSTLVWNGPVLAAPLTMGQIYNYAKDGNTTALKNLGKQVDAIGRDGNTNLCRAVYKNDYKTFNTLRIAGASVKHPCVQRIPAEQIKSFNQGYADWAKGINTKMATTAGGTKTANMATTGTVATETGLSTTAMVGIGVGATALIGGGVALAAGGGGGGGGHSKPACSGNGTKDDNGVCQCNTGYAGGDCAECAENYDKYDTKTCHLTKGCVHGTQIGDSCKCDSAWLGNDICSVGTVCPANYKSSCDVGYTHSKTCISGDDTLYLCDKCDTGYTKIGGVCVAEINCNGRGKQNSATTCSCDTGWGGNTCDTCDTANGYGHYGTSGCYLDQHCSASNHLHQEGGSCVCDTGYPILYNGVCYEELNCGTNGHQVGDSCECNTGWDSSTNCTTCDTAGGYISLDGGCYLDQHCDASKHLHQEGNNCVCDNGYPHKYNGTCYMTETCETNEMQQGDTCVCLPNYERVNGVCTWTSCPANKYKSGSSCLSCPANSTSPAGSTSINQCTCVRGYTKSANGQCIGDAITHEDTGKEIVGKTLKNGTRGNNGTVKVVTNATSSVVGLDAQNKGGNAYAESGNKTASIEVIQRGSGDVYGMRANLDSEQSIRNVVTTAYTANGTIKITDTGSGTGNIYGMYSNASKSLDNAMVGEDSVKAKATGIIDILNTSDKNVYGILNKTNSAYEDEYNCGTYNTDGDVGTAIAQIKIENSGNGDVYGIKSIQHQLNAASTDQANSNASIFIQNSGLGTVYGQFGTGKIFNARAGHDRGDAADNSTSIGLINIENIDSSDVYGIKSTSSDKYIYNAQAWDGSTAKGTIRVNNVSDGNVYGMNGKYINTAEIQINGNGTKPVAESTINIINHDRGDVYGLFSNVSGSEIKHLSFTGVDESSNGKGLSSTKGKAESTIEMANITNGLAVGIYSKNGTVENSGVITIHNLSDGTAVGILTDSGTITNSGTITINRVSYTDNKGTDDTSDDITYAKASNQGGTAIGIYGGADSVITNTSNGKIIINNAENAYGIYSEGAHVTNNGQIIIDGNANHSNAIKLNGGQLFQNGQLVATSGLQSLNSLSVSKTLPVADMENLFEIPTQQSTSLNLNDFGGTVIASATSQFVVDGNLSGDLMINNSVIASGFDKIYTVTDMIQADDITGLNLNSQSALFDAKLAYNGSDVVMTMKGFDTATKNSSLAEFLTRNYTAGNNEAFFNKLKSFGDTHSLTNSLDKLTGKEMLSRFNFEDMTMMRELNFDMNEKLFHNKDRAFALAGSVRPMAFRGDTGSDARYSLYNKRDGKWSVGLGVAFTNVRSDNAHDDDDRRDSMYQLVVPIGYRTHGFNLMTSPRIGYARGTYDRTGFDNKNYDGTIEKRVYGLMNEARYPFTFGDWTLEPAAEFNILGYTQRGHEEDKDYALRIKSQNTYSVESGIGLYLTKAKELSKDSRIKLTAGVATYHEFADPYRLRVGMEGMDGSFTLRDENRSDNRGVIRAGFDYEEGDYSLYGSIISYIDREIRTSLKSGIKWKF